MTKTWIEKEYIDLRFGFPVHLLDVPMKELRGEAVPMVNGKFLRFAVLSALVFKPGPLNGHEVRFIRLWLEKTLVAFGQELGLTHAAIKKWESMGDKPTGTNRINDFYMRFLILEKLLQEELPWMLPSKEATPDFIQKLQEAVVVNQSPGFLQKIRETITHEIAEPPVEGSSIALPVSQIPSLVSGPQATRQG